MISGAKKVSMEKEEGREGGLEEKSQDRRGGKRKKSK